jgi:hypothetical protein
MNVNHHIPLPPEIPAYNCAVCGAATLNPETICELQGLGTRADWCGSKGAMPPKYCRNRSRVDRHQCVHCGQTALNAQLLCEPVKFAIPGE